MPRPRDGSPADRRPDGGPSTEHPDGSPADGRPDGHPADRRPDGGPVTGRPDDGPTPGRPHGRPQPAPSTPAHGFTPFAEDGEGASRPAPGADAPDRSGPGRADGGPPGAASGPVRAPTSTGTGSAASPFLPQGSVPTPRQEYIDAFRAPAGEDRPGGPEGADDDVFAAGAPERGPHGPGRDTGRSVVFPREGDGAADESANAPENSELGAQGPQFSSRGKGGKGRTFTGVAAAAVTTVLAVVVAGQVAEQQDDGKARALGGKERVAGSDAASRSNARPTQQAAPATYDEKMAKAYPLDEKLAASGRFKPAGGDAKAPGHGRVWRYRVDVEEGMGLDGELFADAVHKTLNDGRSWAHGGRRTFERVGSGDADFVITLASPGTTAKWCARSGLDTTEDNVSCDSAATERVMINAYRWAQGAETYGPDKMHAYRQMLINHEVGHRLGHNHESCGRQGALAPVMMQQTKFLTTDGATCRPNAWPFPEGH
ncbi:DUF3152 domain-containing protein [Streptomyces sp. NPDC018045]|uniref:DUF3152 domain-containing protein n=1 Tax=Streptomyces sp. NPDC018045 TaxID=3365037 RepID=UPI0037AF0E58